MENESSNYFKFTFIHINIKWYMDFMVKTKKNKTKI